MPPGTNEGQIKKRFNNALDLRGYTGDRTDQDAVYLFWFGVTPVSRGGVVRPQWQDYQNHYLNDLTLDWREIISDKAEYVFDVQIHGNGDVFDTDTGSVVIVPVT